MKRLALRRGVSLGAGIFALMAGSTGAAAQTANEATVESKPSKAAKSKHAPGAAEAVIAPPLNLPHPVNAPTSVLPSTLAFQPLPYDETYTQYADPTMRTTTWAKLKHIPLWTNGYLTIGGDARLRTETRDHLNFGRGAEDRGLDVQHRVRLWADIHWTDYLRTFTEIEATDTHGANVTPNAVDANTAELHQAFAEISLPTNESGGRFIVRAGRQEISFGKARLFDARNAPNTRRSFDAARTQWQNGEWRIGLLGGWAVRDKLGSFNDSTNYDFSFIAAHAARKLNPLLKNAELEILYIHSDRKGAAVPLFNARRDTLSARLAGRQGKLDYDIEIIGQHGETAAGQTIKAWFYGMDTAYQLPGTWKPRVGFRTDIGSGDRHSGNGTSGTYDFLWSRGQTFTAEFGYSNLIQAGLSFGMKPSKKLTMEVTASGLWRTTNQDNLYAMTGAILRRANESSAHYVGLRNTARLDYQWNRYVVTGLYINRVQAGKFLHETGDGKNLLYTSVYISSRF
ncbi:MULTISPECIES: alginate export family protein [unclassified Novosphingobium]|uniref:alginate export family protein n=1 Tax=unclassified Novosphingobium TaxID=2644732 RepID=UPI00144517B1|nr:MULTISPECIES: alginate export family protein [unclassified Novosphingobium]NKJ45134.1 hypothetical protein [Novosphingobium sp. SG720]NMN07654.1 hypothetical protein [Novosphingobium sp. SG919]NMN89964.1 hypothetical protein [Novosphingobium sp. SG916]